MRKFWRKKSDKIAVFYMTKWWQCGVKAMTVWRQNGDSLTETNCAKLRQEFERFFRATKCALERTFFFFALQYSFIFFSVYVMSAYFPESMRDREQQKRSHFDAFWHVKRWGVFFAIARSWSIFLRAHFAVIFVHFGVILHDFAYPSKSLFRVYEWPMKQFRICNFHHFWSVFDTGKIEVVETFCGSSGKWR